MKTKSLIKQTAISAKSIKQTAVLVFTLLVTEAVLAGGSLSGGLNKAESNLTLIKTWGIRVAGIGAVVYLLWKGIETWRGRGDWGDFGMAVVHVALAGAAATLAGWAFGVFG